MKEEKYTFEKRFEMLMKAFDKSREEWEKSLKESRENWERQMAESKSESDRRAAALDERIDKVSRSVFGISTSNGMMAEEMVHNSLVKDNTFAGIRFDDVRKNFQVQTADLQPKTDIDVLMVNGDTIAIIEIKYKVEKDDLSELVNNKVNLFRQYYPRYSNHKILLGIGGMSFENGVFQVANNKGIGIIKVVGDKVEYHTDNIKEY